MKHQLKIYIQPSLKIFREFKDLFVTLNNAQKISEKVNPLPEMCLLDYYPVRF